VDWVFTWLKLNRWTQHIFETIEHVCFRVSWGDSVKSVCRILQSWCAWYSWGWASNEGGWGANATFIRLIGVCRTHGLTSLCTYTNNMNRGKNKLKESKVNYSCYQKHKIRRFLKLRCLLLSVMVVKHVFIQKPNFCVSLHSSSTKFTDVFLKRDKMSVLYKSLNSWWSFCHSLSCIYRVNTKTLLDFK